MDVLLREAAETGEHTLKRTLGPLSLTALGVGAVIGAGIFVMTGLGATYAGPALTISFIVSGIRVRLGGLVLCGVRRDDSAGGQCLHLRLRCAGRVARLDHRLGLDSGIRHGREHRLVRLVQPFRRTAQYFSPEDAAVACLRPLDGSSDRRKHDRARPGSRGRTPRSASPRKHFPIWCTG